LKNRLESIRLKIGAKMNLGNVRHKTVPKMCLISPARNGGLVNTRTFIPHVCHPAIGVLGAVSVAAGVLLPGSIGEGLIDTRLDVNSPHPIEHPAGAFTVQLTVEHLEGAYHFNKSAVIRTARLISKGDVFTP